MPSPYNYTSLAEFLVGDKEKNIRERLQLVRILSRSSTLPKVENIYIHPSSTQPDSFYIQAGISITIGTNYLAKPQAALLCLRYGLEWQIWYKNQQDKNFDPRICDLAACKVAEKFYELTPHQDKAASGDIPKKLAENIFKFSQNDKVEAVLPTIDFEGLKQFHNQHAPDSIINQKEIAILNHLASPLEYLMMSGGDQRLNVDPDLLLNKYGCRPFPRPESFTFASSTATSISNAAYNKAQVKRKLLIKKSFKEGLEQTVSDFAEFIKKSLKTSLKLPENTSLLLAPSGTDISLYITGICQAIVKKEIVHILVAADETGSGVPLALKGQHFSDRTSQGDAVKKGTPIPGFKQGELHPIKLRLEKGGLKETDTVDQEVHKAVKNAINQGKQPILHAMDQSKLGYSAPSEQCLRDLQKKYGSQVLTLIDNSQLRVDPNDIQAYINRGYLMTITGSKFFTGPPFNGALLIPQALAKDWETCQGKLPKGLLHYSYENEWPDWPMTRDLQHGFNLGTNMRWFASICEIERYYKTPLSLRYLGVDLFCDHVDNAITAASFLEHLPSYNTNQPRKAINPQKMKDRQTIFPFFIKQNGKVLTKPEIDRLYRLLNQDLSNLFQEESEDTQRLATRACHIGQPVSAIYKDGSPSGVVRINLGARVISESWKDRDSSIFFRAIQEQMIQVDIIIRKIELILKHPQLLTE